MYLIYSQTSKTTDKRYIGVTSRSIKERWWEHLKHANAGTLKTHFANAINKYGKKDFYSTLLDTIEIKEDAYAEEILLIEKYDTYHNGYNSTLGGDMPPDNYDKISGKNNYQFNGYYHTPFGKFETMKDATKKTNMSWQKIRKRCKVDSTRIITKNAVRQSPDLVYSDVGKTFEEIGYYFNREVL